MRQYELHEAAHAAAAIVLGRRVESVEMTVGHTERDEQMGAAIVPLPEETPLSQLPIVLVGYWSEAGIRGWPPPFEKARTEDLESLDLILLHLGLDEESYDAVVAYTRDTLLTDSDYLKLRDAIHRALRVVPRLEERDLDALCRATGVPIPDNEEQQLCPSN